MALPTVGQTLYLHVQEHTDRRGHARLLDIRDEALYLDEPLAEGENGAGFWLPLGDRITVSYRAADRTFCFFDSTVLSHTMLDGLPTLVIDHPLREKIQRVQQRAFVRVEVPVTVSYLCVHSGQPQSLITGTGTTRDLSGGGLSFYAQDNLSMRVGDQVTVRFSLPGDPKSASPIEARGPLIRRTELLDHNTRKLLNRVLISMHFAHIGDLAQQRIVRYAFRRQIEMRDRGY